MALGGTEPQTGAPSASVAGGPPLAAERRTWYWRRRLHDAADQLTVAVPPVGAATAEAPGVPGAVVS